MNTGRSILAMKISDFSISYVFQELKTIFIQSYLVNKLEITRLTSLVNFNKCLLSFGRVISINVCPFLRTGSSEKHRQKKKDKGMGDTRMRRVLLLFFEIFKLNPGTKRMRLDARLVCWVRIIEKQVYLIYG